jgi:hypothetical protein
MAHFVYLLFNFGGEGGINASLPTALHARSKLLRVKFVVEPIRQLADLGSNPTHHHCLSQALTNLP